MTKPSKTLLFFGNERLVSGLSSTEAPILSGLIERGYTVKAVISHETATRSRKARPLEVARIAEHHHIPVYLPHKPTDILDELKAYKADAAILVAYGKIVPQAIIDLFPDGIINIHPSLLPRWRGPTPIESAIAGGDKETGVSIMRLTAGMDEGPVYTQEIVPLEVTDTKFTAYEKISAVSAKLLFEILPQILDRSLEPVPQDDSQATYSHLLSKEDALLQPSTLTALEAERQVRAYLGFPKTKISAQGHDIIVTKAHVSSHAATPLDIECMDGKYLSITQLVAPSGKTMTADAFIHGYLK